MCDPLTAVAAAGAIISAGSQVYGGMAAKAQGQYEQRVNERNAQLEESARVDAIARGETDQMQHYRKLAQAIGEANVKAAASGLDTSFGSSAGLVNDIALMGYEDSATISQNTTKEVKGYDINAANYRAEGQAALSRGNAAQTGAFIGAAGTILSSASQIGKMNVDRGYNPWGGVAPKKGG